jgi:hypothetical protein
MSGSIAFGSPIKSSYAQSTSIASEEKKSDIDADSVLTVSSSQ